MPFFANNFFFIPMYSSDLLFLIERIGREKNLVNETPLDGNVFARRTIGWNYFWRNNHIFIHLRIYLNFLQFSFFSFFKFYGTHRLEFILRVYLFYKLKCAASHLIQGIWRFYRSKHFEAMQHNCVYAFTNYLVQSLCR